MLPSTGPDTNSPPKACLSPLSHRAGALWVPWVPEVSWATVTTDGSFSVGFQTRSHYTAQGRLELAM